MTVTLSDTGGQPVEEYSVSHTGRDRYFLTPLTVIECTCLWLNSALSTCQVTLHGRVMAFSGSADLQFIGNVTGLSLMNGVTYTVSVVARNSVGTSKTFTGTVFVPCEWVLTMCMLVVCGVYVVYVVVQYITAYSPSPSLPPPPPPPPLPCSPSQHHHAASGGDS